MKNALPFLIVVYMKFLLVVFVHPLDELYTVIIMSVYKACVSCSLPEYPL